MTAPLLFLLLLLLCAPAGAQTDAPANSAPAPQASLQIDGTERGFFETGNALSKGAFAYAALAKQAALVDPTRSKTAQLTQLGKLAPLARQSREQAHEAFGEALTLMQSLDAPPSALAPVSHAAARLSKPLMLTAASRPLASFDSEAAYTLSAMDEFATLSTMPENAAVRDWLASPGLSHSAQVWYGEGEIAALSQIAATQQMPELLPSAQQLATDLRGLRDWLALRLPETPSLDQTQLKADLEAFLQQAELTEKPGHSSRKPLTSAQLQALGDISQRLQAQILSAPAAPPPSGT